MTRETKVGLVVAGSFLCLVGIVLASKLKQGENGLAETAEAQNLSTPVAVKKRDARPRNPEKKGASADKGQSRDGKPASTEPEPTGLVLDGGPSHGEDHKPASTALTGQHVRDKTTDLQKDDEGLVLPPKGGDPAEKASSRELMINEGNPLPKDHKARAKKGEGLTVKEDKHDGGGNIKSIETTDKGLANPDKKGIPVAGAKAVAAEGEIKKEGAEARLSDRTQPDKSQVRAASEGGLTLSEPKAETAGNVAPIKGIDTKATAGTEKAAASGGSEVAHSLAEPGTKDVREPKTRGAEKTLEAPVVVPPGSEKPGVKASATASTMSPEKAPKTFPLGTPTTGESAPITVPASTGASGSAAAVVPKVESFEVQIHQASAGDTFAGISQRFYSSDKYEQALLKFNRDNQPAEGMDQDPPILKAGQRVSIPPATILENRYGSLIPGSRPAAPAAPESNSRSLGDKAPMAELPVLQVSTKGAAPPTRPYTVQDKGETLYEIARDVLHNKERWAEIYHLNEDRSTPERIVPGGTILRLPADAHVEQTNHP